MDDSIAADGAAIMRYGVKRMDALHLASARAARCNWFLTTDRGILKHISSLNGMRVANPVDFAMEDES
jgi:predicted nucleic acid-binding protein